VGGKAVSRFDGRTVVVTGATGELGLAVAALVVQQGGRVIAPVRSTARAAGLTGLGEPVRTAAGIDLADPVAVEAFYADIPDLWASIHCAGGFAMGKIADLSPADLKKMLEMNTTSAFLCCWAAVAAMRRKGGGGRIVNVVSQQALDPRRGAGMTPYTMSKAALAALTVALGEELAPEAIWVNAIAPSIMDTQANRQAMPKADFDRWPKLQEVAEVAAFLASPDNRAARGGIVPVFGRS
jgi:NAD(P)-dependent dehydrogenase (short-subunit alcohol dehydrogenase family)